MARLVWALSPSRPHDAVRAPRVPAFIREGLYLPEVECFHIDITYDIAGVAGGADRICKIQPIRFLIWLATFAGNYRMGQKLPRLNRAWRVWRTKRMVAIFHVDLLPLGGECALLLQLARSFSTPKHYCFLPRFAHNGHESNAFGRSFSVLISVKEKREQFAPVYHVDG
jgi:hypothetical protein